MPNPRVSGPRGRAFRRQQWIDFKKVADAARPHLIQLVPQWLPEGRRVGNEWVARNPTRDDRTPGSFKTTLHTAAWADFATGDKGRDVISLLAYLERISQIEAARRICKLLGLAG